MSELSLMERLRQIREDQNPQAQDAVETAEESIQTPDEETVVELTGVQSPELLGTDLNEDDWEEDDSAELDRHLSAGDRGEELDPAVTSDLLACFGKSADGSEEGNDGEELVTMTRSSGGQWEPADPAVADNDEDDWDDDDESSESWGDDIWQQASWSSNGFSNRIINAMQRSDIPNLEAIKGWSRSEVTNIRGFPRPH